MTDPIERRIAELQLPEPTPELDRRMHELFETRRPRSVSAAKGRRGVLAVAGGALAAGFLGILFNAGPTEQDNLAARLPDRRVQLPVVESVNVRIPSLDLPLDEAANEQDRLFPSGTVVVSIGTQQENSK